MIRIAVPYRRDGTVLNPFEHAWMVKLYDTEGSRILRSEVVCCRGAVHSLLVGLLSARHVDRILCDQISDGTRRAAAKAGIPVTEHLPGEADAIVKAYCENH